MDIPYFNQFLAAEIKRLDEAILDLRRSAAERDTMSQRAIQQSNENLDRRVEALNEFRAQLSAQQSEYITRREYEAKHETLVTANEAINKQISEIQRSAAWTTGRIMGGVGVISTSIIIMGVIIKFLH